MIAVRTFTLAIACAGLGALMLPGAEFASYRHIQFGANLAAAAKQAGTNSSEVRIVHQRPALIQEMDWRPRSQAETDPVKDGLLCFFNGELYRIVVTYDSYKVEGMQAADMIDAISKTYGVAAKPAVEIAYRSIYGESTPVLARWENPEYAYDLVQTGDRSSFALVLYSKRVDALAKTAIAEAVRLEAQEAPRREIDRQKKRDDAERVALDKARSVNRPNFRP